MHIVTTAQKDFQRQKAMLLDVPLFGGISSTDLESIFSDLIQVDYQPGEVVFKQGSLPSDIYIVASGEICIQLEGKTPHELLRFGQGECFGETSVIGILDHSATAMTTKETRLLALSSETLLQLHDNKPRVFGHLILNIAREACRRLYKTNEMILQYADNH